VSSRAISVLAVADFFLPGFRGGGPIRTLENLRKQLAGDVTFSIFTRDRDLGSKSPYFDVAHDTWTDALLGPIYYASSRKFGIVSFRKALSAAAFDIIYLNSFFSVRGSILLNAWLRISSPNVPILLAPRGEFSAGALSVKKLKKRMFLEFARRSGLYQHVYWHASTQLEAEDILRQFPEAGEKVLIAPDPVVFEPLDVPTEELAKREGRARIAFISRISPKKNLDGLLEYLRGVRSDVELDIFGPNEDLAYWQDCEAKISQLPAQIKVQHHGLLSPEEVSPTFARYDLFAFPTHGENFGHVIFEALRVGTPVLVSDQTPWQKDKNGALITLPLDDAAAWQLAIERAADRTQTEQAELRAATIKYAKHYVETDRSRQTNLALFHSLV
jgi:glycosyltransferase involved in cell wall biosynthesis